MTRYFKNKTECKPILVSIHFFLKFSHLTCHPQSTVKKTKTKPSSNVFARYSVVSNNITKSASRSHDFVEVAKRGMNEKWALLFKL